MAMEQDARTLPSDHPAWDLEAHYLGLAIANLTCTVSPQKVILGGGVMDQQHLFPKIRGVVTERGGILTHAAISAWEYGITTVVGTWVATSSIKDGDIIRVDGTNGVVEIISSR